MVGFLEIIDRVFYIIIITGTKNGKKTATLPPKILEWSGLRFHIIIQRRAAYLGFASVSVVNGPAVVTESCLCKPLRVTDAECSFSPGVTVAV